MLTTFKLDPDFEMGDDEVDAASLCSLASSLGHSQPNTPENGFVEEGLVIDEEDPCAEYHAILSSTIEPIVSICVAHAPSLHILTHTTARTRTSYSALKTGMRNGRATACSMAVARLR